ncbi:MAG: DUF4153 domain-containing protein [Candidatus Eisenbacteria bacterium]|uniref:DUF4153 domain-containing protein n=1 Tax=Eiseniibacteriota bacterium TaxID=2212470 RepID=A0A948W2Q6_UNCEI|nr:DUF4153 domain-containing protein [Candidatus Eisenbacteria bacterium]MBU2690232.1 DUF4153 domain-containing protein [Candidatus Eisenbacteria bacterium]
MRVPSMSRLAIEASRVFLRFPFVLTAAIAAGISAAIAVGHSGYTVWVRCLMGAQLGIPFLLALTLFGERPTRLRWPFSVAGTALILLYYLTLPAQMSGAVLTRFFQFNIAAHLLVASLPYIRRNEPDGFWQFNKSLFLHLLKSLLFTGVLVIGLDVALLALDKLFGLEISGKVYARIDLLMLFIFNTWHFLGGVPRDFAALGKSRDYPRALKVFAQYILAPLVALYLALLMAYLVKVLATSEWPSGWIGWLVSSVAAAGLFSLVLLHPLTKEQENRWIATYARVYFLLMLPSVGMLIMALAKRIGQYGLTENRYFMCVLSLWLLGVSIAGALNRLKRLEPLPATLCLIAFLTSFGPWGAYSIARSSQVGRMEQLLSSEGLLAEGKLTTADKDVDIETRRELSASLDYLMEYHGVSSVERWLTPAQNAELALLGDSLTEGPRQRELSRQVMVYLDLEYSADWARHPNREWYSFQCESGGEAIPLPASSYLQKVRFSDDRSQTFTISERAVQISQNMNRIRMSEGGKTLLTLQLEPLMAELRDRDRNVGEGEVPGSLMVVEAATESLRARLLVDSIRWHFVEDKPQLQRLSGYLLMEPLPPPP